MHFRARGGKAINGRVTSILVVLILTLVTSACGGGAPTDTPVPPTDTPAPPTDTPVPPTDTPIPLTPEPEVDFTDPTSVLQAVFTAAQTENFAVLSGLCDPLGESDDDTAMICAITDDHPDKDMFIEYFATGKVNGDAVINGDRAEVPFLFGPDGDREETMGFVQRDGQWYLSDF